MQTKRQYIIRLAIACGLVLIFLLWLGRPAKGSQKRGDNPYRVETFSIQTPGKLEVKTSGGFIRVKGSKDHTVRVEMMVLKNGKTLSPADTDLDKFDITIKHEGNRVQAIAKHKDDNWWKFWDKDHNVSISFVVYTPEKMDTDLDTSGGSIETSGLTGHQKIRTSGGHLKLTELKGNIEARTSGGHITLANIEGTMNARTSGGHIKAQQTNGTLKLHTSGGGISLDNVAGSVEASTSGGHITADLKRIDKFVRLRTSGGNIHIEVPADRGLNLDLHGSRVKTDLKNFSGDMEDDDVEGTINGGGAQLEARTSGGTVSVSFK